MGRVYKTIDKEIGERVAVKLVRPDIASNRKLIERFQNELITTRRIAHRNVCRMYDLGRDGDTRFITMEYVPGEDLEKIPDPNGTLDDPEGAQSRGSRCARACPKPTGWV